MPAWMPDVFLAITLVTAVVLLILCNTVCRVREEVSERKESQERILQEEKSGETQKKWGIRGSVIFTAVICVFVGVLLVTGDIEISVTREQIDIAGSYWSDYTVVGRRYSFCFLYRGLGEQGKGQADLAALSWQKETLKTVNLAPISCMHIQGVTVMLSWKRQTRWCSKL